MCVCIIWVSETKQKRSTAQVYNPVYHVQGPIVLYNVKVLLAIPLPHCIWSNCVLGALLYGSKLILRYVIHKYICSSLQSFCELHVEGIWPYFLGGV